MRQKRPNGNSRAKRSTPCLRSSSAALPFMPESAGIALRGRSVGHALEQSEGDRSRGLLHPRRIMMKFRFFSSFWLWSPCADPVSGETTASYAIQVESFKDLQKATKKTDPGLVISEITFKLKTPDKEAVWIQGNRLFTPSAFAIEEDKPRFVIDIKDTRPVKRELSRIATER